MNIELSLPVQPATLGIPPAVQLPPAPKGRGRKKDPQTPPATPPAAPNTPPADTTAAQKAALLAELNTAIENLNAQRGVLGAALKEYSSRTAVLVSVTKKLVESKLFGGEEIVNAIKSRAEKLGLGDKSISAILIKAGLRQRAPRSDKGSGKGDNSDAPANTTPPTTSLPSTPTALAAAIVSAFGGDKEKAAQFIGAAYTALKLG